MKYATIFVSIIIVIAVWIPGRNLPDVNIGGYDKLIHMAMFAVWAIAVRYDFSSTLRFFPILFAGFLFSIVTEVSQLMVEGRSFDFYDMAADIIGLLAGILISGPFVKWIRQL